MRNYFKKIFSSILIFSILVGTNSGLSYANNVRDKNVKISESESKFIGELKKIKEKKSKKLDEKNGEEIVRIIVQTKELSEVNGGKPNFEDLKEEILKISKNVSFKKDFSYLISGFSLEVPQKYVSKIASLKEVKKVSYARTFKPMMADAVKLTDATKVWTERSYKGEGMVISIIDSGIDVDHKDMRLTNPSLAKIKNIKESSDTKYTIKVPYGYNYADGTDIVKDSDAVGKSMHGMHVAGISAANATDEDYKNGNGIRGVAPEAQLLAMKVFSNNQEIGTAYEDTIVKAIEDSVKLGADVINMSLGVDNGFGTDTDPEIVAIKEAREQGVICVVSAGNEAMSTTKSAKSRIPTNDLNLKDNAALGSPSAGEHAFSVASSNNSTPTSFFGNILGAENKEFVFEIGTNKNLINKEKEYEVVDVGVGEADNYTVKDLTGKAVFVLRGDISFEEKLRNAQEHKAEIVIISNNTEEPFKMAGVEKITIPSVVVDKVTGELLKEKIKLNEKIRFNMTPNYEETNEVSSFTAYGPSPELEFKPEVMAPGGHIISTVNNNKYEEMSGTSMAAPHLSGTIALMLGELKDENLTVPKHEFVRLSLTNTSTPLKDTAAKTDMEVSPRRQGAGLINVDRALKNRVIITDEFGRAVKSLKEIEGIVSFDLTLTNYSNESKSYNVEFSNVLTEFTDESTFQVKDIVMKGAKISSDKNSIQIPANSTAKIKITLDVTNAPKNQFAEGFIYFKSESDPTLVYPYLAFNGDWNSEPIFDKGKSESGTIYDTLGLVSGGNYLGSTFDYMTFSEKVDPDKVAFSPNGDDNLDNVVLVLGLLRSAKILDVDVVSEQSEDAKSLVHITTTHDVRKSHYAHKNGVPFANGVWDGQVFNQSTGEYESIKDGQYYIRVSAGVATKTNARQTIYLPLKVDTTKPELEVLESGFVGDEFVIKFTALDSGIGLAEDGVGAYVDNEDKEALTETNGNYEYRVPREKLEDGKEHTITIGAIDEVFNVKTKSITLSNNSVVFYNVNDKVVGSKNKYLSSDLEKYRILGHVGKDISRLLINGVEAVIEDGTFEALIPIKEGENSILFEGFDKSGTLISKPKDDVKHFIIKDTISPEIKIDNINIDEVLKLTSKEVNVKGMVTDNSGSEIKLSVGSAISKTLKSGDSFDISSNIDWTRILRVRAIDKAGNETVKEIRTVFEDDKEEFKIYFKDLSKLEFMNGKSYQVKNDNLEMIGHVNKKIKTLYIDGKEVSIGEDLRFKHLQPLKEVNNHIGVKVVGLDESILFEGGYTVYYDKTVPNLSLDVEVGEDNVIYTNQNPFVLKGNASDNGHGYRLYINGDEVLVFDETGNKDEKSSLREFKKEVDSTTGNTTFIEISDSFGNKFTKRYKFIFDDKAPEVKIENIKDGKVKLPAKLNIQTEEDAKVEISVNGNEYNGELLLDSGSYVVKVRVTDKAGNITVKTFEFEATNYIFDFISKKDDDKKDKNTFIEKDKNTVIKVESENLKNEDVKLKFKRILDIEKYGFNRDDDVELFDIHFVDKSGNIVDVKDGKYSVLIEKSLENKNKVVERVFHVSDKNVLTDMEFKDLGNSVEFKTSHFSIYGIKYKKNNEKTPNQYEEIKGDGTENTVNEGNIRKNEMSIPRTGISKNISIYILLSVISVVLISVFITKKNRI